MAGPAWVAMMAPAPPSLSAPHRLDTPCTDHGCFLRRRLFRWWRALLVWLDWYGIEHCANRTDVCVNHRAYAQLVVRDFDPMQERDW